MVEKEGQVRVVTVEVGRDSRNSFKGHGKTNVVHNLSLGNRNQVNY